MLGDQPYYYVKIDGYTSGPISWDVLKVWAKEGQIMESTKVWSSSTNKWIKAAEIEGIEPAADEPLASSGLIARTIKTFLGLLILGGRRIAGRRRRS